MKIALVTGASRGLGLEWCRQLASDGYTVVLTARRLAAAEAAAADLVKAGLSVRALACDVSKEDDIESLVENFGREYGHLDLLINNAGINSKDDPNDLVVRKSRSLSDLDPLEILRHIEINSISPLMMVKHSRGLLAKAERPVVLSISSWLGSIGIKEDNRAHYSYSASKAALNMLNRSLSIELKEEGIISLVVNPGWVQTDMGGAQADLTPEQSVRGMIENVLNKAGISETGNFYSFNGEIHPW